jgi:hypothetical protein
LDAEQKPITEIAVTQWYATGGTFADDVRVFDRATSAWHARDEDAGRLISFWFVVRDDRGGVTWTSPGAGSASLSARAAAQPQSSSTHSIDGRAAFPAIYASRAAL